MPEEVVMIFGAWSRPVADTQRQHFPALPKPGYDTKYATMIQLATCQSSCCSRRFSALVLKQII
jgi:hypothetical protein